MALTWPSKDPDDVDVFHIVWCSEDGTNDGSDEDDGRLQGDTISGVTWTVPGGITKDSESTASVTIQGVNYPINTVTSITLSGGTVDTEYELTCRVTTANSLQFDQTVNIKVEEH